MPIDNVVCQNYVDLPKDFMKANQKDEKTESPLLHEKSIPVSVVKFAWRLVFVMDYVFRARFNIDTSQISL